MSKSRSRKPRQPEYQAWKQMRLRCYNPRNKDYHNYGGRGITVCPEWLESSRPFVAYIGKRPGPNYSLDRIDNNGNYEPGNVRWATAKQQQQNRRDNRLVTIDGITHCASEWARLLGVSTGSVFHRIEMGTPPFHNPPEGNNAQPD